MRPRYRSYLIFRHLASEYVFSFAISFFFFFVIFIINNVLLLAQDILSKNAPIGDVLRLLFYALPVVVSLSFPFASLLGALMTIGHFVTNREILAMNSAGITKRYLFVPIALIGILLSIVSFLVNDYLLPIGTIRFNELYQRLVLSNPELILDSYSVNNYRNSIIITGNVQGENLDEIVIIDPSSEETGRRVIVATGAQLQREENVTSGGLLSLILENVFSLGINRMRSDRYEYMLATEMRYNILLRDVSIALRTPGPRELGSQRVLEEVRIRQTDLDGRQLTRNRQATTNAIGMINRYVNATNDIASGIRRQENVYQQLTESYDEIAALNEPVYDSNLQLYKIEYYRKYALPLGCLFFTFFAFPVGLLLRRGDRVIAFGIGLIASTVYWTFYIGGQTLGVRQLSIPPILATWFPNLFILGAGMLFLFFSARR